MPTPNMPRRWPAGCGGAGGGLVRAGRERLGAEWVDVGLVGERALRLRGAGPHALERLLEQAGWLRLPRRGQQAQRFPELLSRGPQLTEHVLAGLVEDDDVVGVGAERAADH